MLTRALPFILFILLSTAKRHRYQHIHEVSDLEGRVIKGKDVTTPTQFPWFAALGFLGYLSYQTVDPSTNKTVNRTWSTSSGC